MKKFILITLFLVVSTMPVEGQKNNRFFRFPTNENFIYDICYSKSGTVLFIADGKAIKAFDDKTHQLIDQFSGGHRDNILSIDLSSDSTLLVSGATDSTSVIWDMTDRRPIKTLNLNGIVTSVDISPDDNFLAIGTSSGNAYLFSLENHQQIYVFNDHFADITAVAISPGNNLLATAGGDKSVMLYDIETGNLLSELKGHKDWVRDISFSPDSTKLVSCGDDTRMLHWNINNPEKPRLFNQSKIGFGWLLSVEYYHDSQTYAYGDFQGHVVINSVFAKYSAKTKVPVTKVIFQPNDNGYFKVAVATRGKGVLLIGARNMHFKGDKE